jgi:hypothetical protein
MCGVLRYAEARSGSTPAGGVPGSATDRHGTSAGRAVGGQALGVRPRVGRVAARMTLNKRRRPDDAEDARSESRAGESAWQSAGTQAYAAHHPSNLAAGLQNAPEVCELIWSDLS